MFYVYVIESKMSGELYADYTADLRERIVKHNRSEAASTKKHKLWNIIYYGACLNQKDAKRREHYLKISQGIKMLKCRLKEYFYDKRYK